MAQARRPEQVLATPSHDEMVARVRALLPALRTRAPECERLRRLPDETVKDVIESGLIRLMLPKWRGGYQLDYITLYDTLTLIGSACASTAWVVANMISTNFTPCYWPKEAQDDFWRASLDTLAAGSLIFSAARAQTVKGGYRLHGRWPLVSGCLHAEWLVLGALVEGLEGAARYRMFLVPKADYRIHDTWFSSGLKGTGSNDVEVADQFVPDYRTLTVDETKGGDSPGARVNPGWLYRLPIFALFSTWVGAAVLGAAIGARDDFIANTRNRIARVADQRMADFSGVQRAVGEACALIEAAKALVYRDCHAAQAIAQAGGVPDLAAKLGYRANGAMAAELCLRAVDLLHRMAGAGGLYESNPLARHFRDIHAGTSHITQNLEANVLPQARAALGLPIDVPTL